MSLLEFQRRIEGFHRRLELSKVAAEVLRDGMDVVVIQDDGSTKPGRTRSEPWELGHGAWLIKLEGRSGGFDCARVRPAVLPEKAEVGK